MSISPEYLALSERYEKEMQIARNVQQGLLSVEVPELDGVAMSAVCIPADSIGGDFYTFVNRSERGFKSVSKTPGVVEYLDKREQYMGIAIGDVAGHGIGSALVMALASGIIREAGIRYRSPADVLKVSNQTLVKFISRSMVSHITAFYGTLSLDTKMFSYCKAGHMPGILIRQSGECELLEAPGVFLGMYNNEEYEEQKIQLKSGDRLVLYTDGITEARNQHGEFYEFERLEALLVSHRSLSPEQLKEKILLDVSTFMAGEPLRDDQTLVVLDV